MSRIATWGRGTGRVWVVKQGTLAEGALFDHLAYRPILQTDSPTLSVRAYSDDGAVNPATITGANTVSMAWDATNLRWAGELPYIDAFDALTSVRVRVMVTYGARTARPLDAVVTFATADGR